MHPEAPAISRKVGRLIYDSLRGSTQSDFYGRGSRLGRTNQGYQDLFLLCLPAQESYPPGTFAVEGLARKKEWKAQRSAGGGWGDGVVGMGEETSGKLRDLP